MVYSDVRNKYGFSAKDIREVVSILVKDFQMAEYAKRTCTRCGKRDIQPNMKQVEIEYDTGSSKSGVSGATVVGMLLGHRGSQRAIGRTIFNSSKRTYKRKKTVWVCKHCNPWVNPTVGSISDTIKGILGLGLILLILIGIFAGK